ncbi:hypothetical protein DN069_06445 [Streptacidiphilus pinicola]|uniref:DUF4386 family protein n=1 Tax=Streptacidiphilus pinicola TaxID=2219663 RepID=A0A2X0J849_9ACTN|nr:hypothetical protein [Streptacidiphilus pinicola]RAG86446.1 hypothetical protein DN069_06445 [Streptacidiphilus pinicola]
MSNERMARWMGPLALAFLVSIVLGFFVLAPSAPNQNASAASVIAYYQAHGTAALAGIYVIGVGLVLLAFFVGALRIALSKADGGHDWMPTTAFAGGILFIGAFAVNGVLHFALIQAAHNGRVDMVRTLNFIDNNSQVAVLLGVSVLALATGAAILAEASLPAWLGWLSIVIGVLPVIGGLGFIALLALPILLTILGFVIGNRTTATAAEGTGASTPRRTTRAPHRLTLRHH